MATTALFAAQVDRSHAAVSFSRGDMMEFSLCVCVMSVGLVGGGRGHLPPALLPRLPPEMAQTPSRVVRRQHPDAQHHLLHLRHQREALLCPVSDVFFSLNPSFLNKI